MAKTYLYFESLSKDTDLETAVNALCEATSFDEDMARGFLEREFAISAADQDAAETISQTLSAQGVNISYQHNAVPPSVYLREIYRRIEKLENKVEDLTDASLALTRAVEQQPSASENLDQLSELFVHLSLEMRKDVRRSLLSLFDDEATPDADELTISNEPDPLDEPTDIEEASAPEEADEEPAQFEEHTEELSEDEISELMQESDVEEAMVELDEPEEVAESEFSDELDEFEERDEELEESDQAEEEPEDNPVEPEETEASEDDVFEDFEAADESEVPAEETEPASEDAGSEEASPEANKPKDPFVDH